MSTSAQALEAARRLQTIMRSYGVECVIQLRQGASSSGWMTPLSQRAGVMAHHVASRPSQGNTPFYNLVRNGRSDLPGPLANGYMGYDGVYRIITLGWANHPGAGGAITLAGRTVPRNNGRPYFWGTEFEGGYEPWSAFMHDKMARAHAAVLDWLNLPTTAHIEHSTWAPTRKVDRLGYTAASGRSRISAVRGNSSAPSTPSAPPASPKGFLMALTDKQQKELYDAIMDLRPGRAGKYHDGPGFRVIRDARNAAQSVSSRFTDVWRFARKAERLVPGRSGIGHQGDLWPRVAKVLDAPEQEPIEVPIEELADELAARLDRTDAEKLAELVVDKAAQRLAGTEDA